MEEVGGEHLHCHGDGRQLSVTLRGNQGDASMPQHGNCDRWNTLRPSAQDTRQPPGEDSSMYMLNKHGCHNSHTLTSTPPGPFCINRKDSSTPSSPLLLHSPSISVCRASVLFFPPYLSPSLSRLVVIMRQPSEGSINLIAAISSANTLMLNKDKQLLSAPDAMQ